MATFLKVLRPSLQLSTADIAKVYKVCLLSCCLRSHRLLVCSPTYMLALHGGGRFAEATLVRWCAGQRTTVTMWTKVSDCASFYGDRVRQEKCPTLKECSAGPEVGSACMHAYCPTCPSTCMHACVLAHLPCDESASITQVWKSPTINQMPAQCQPHSFSVGGKQRCDAVVPGFGGPTVNPKTLKPFGALLPCL